MRKNGDTLQVSISVKESLHELLIAELGERGFDSFEQTNDILHAFADPDVWSDEVSRFLTDWLKTMPEAASFDVTIVPSQNWNKEWEASIRPINVGQFLIKPSWSPVEASVDRIEIQIDPQMSFGTGYHASTRLALLLLRQSLKSGDSVLDAGTGTGILSIAAAKLGALSVFAFDNDPWAEQNALVNVQSNGVAQSVSVHLGDISSVPNASYDLVLANIHLTVIEDMMPSFLSRLSTSGRLVVSGLLVSDKDRIRALCDRFGLSVVTEVSEDEWYAATLGSGGR